MTEEFLELANGCLCCSIKDSGVAAIENLMRRRGAFDYILLETTGLADPGLSFLPSPTFRRIDVKYRPHRVHVLAERGFLPRARHGNHARRGRMRRRRRLWSTGRHLTSHSPPIRRVFTRLTHITAQFASSKWKKTMRPTASARVYGQPFFCPHSPHHACRRSNTQLTARTLLPCAGRSPPQT